MNFTEALGLDVGERKIGVARIGSVARLAEPLRTIENNEATHAEIRKILVENNSDTIVIGLPRNLSGDDTEQTVFAREFAATLEDIGIDIVLQDEALTSKQAEELIAQGVYKNNADGNPVTDDEIAACLILEDFARESEQG